MSLSVFNLSYKLVFKGVKSLNLAQERYRQFVRLGRHCDEHFWISGPIFYLCFHVEERRKKHNAEELSSRGLRTRAKGTRQRSVWHAELSSTARSKKISKTLGDTVVLNNKGDGMNDETRCPLYLEKRKERKKKTETSLHVRIRNGDMGAEALW